MTTVFPYQPARPRPSRCARLVCEDQTRPGRPPPRSGVSPRFAVPIAQAPERNENGRGADGGRGSGIAESGVEEGLIDVVAWAAEEHAGLGRSEFGKHLAVCCYERGGSIRQAR
jgi:hypothetical protein